MTYQKLDNELSASQQVTNWLEGFDQALRVKDIDKAAECFVEEGFWRDLISFTWNIKTLEGQDEIKDMLSHTLETAEPYNWKLDGEAVENDGVIEAWISFNTKVAKGYGHLRLRNGKAWTLLTTMVELKDFPEKRKRLRPKGAEHGADHLPPSHLCHAVGFNISLQLCPELRTAAVKQHEIQQKPQLVRGAAWENLPN